MRTLIIKKVLIATDEKTLKRRNYNHIIDSRTGMIMQNTIVGGGMMFMFNIYPCLRMYQSFFINYYTLLENELSKIYN